ncbi:MAG: hypothetical protein LBD93_03895 [Treponema sp.]|jgi:hypothetical protein|nr:hypothetical protein [Treponema sp.]
MIPQSISGGRKGVIIGIVVLSNRRRVVCPAIPQGTAISWALNFLRDKGPVKMLDQEKQVDFKVIPLSLFADSRAYSIAEYATLFSSNPQHWDDKILMVKKAARNLNPWLSA